MSPEVYFRIEAKPVTRGSEESGELLVIIHDVTEEQFYRQKLDAIHEAGVELSNLSPEEVFHMEVKDRIELLKSNILHYTQEILSYEKVEIRLVNHRTGKLEPLLSAGIDKSLPCPLSPLTIFAFLFDFIISWFIISCAYSIFNITITIKIKISTLTMHIQ